MDGADRLAFGSAYRRVVRLPDGVLLNRDWDDRATPRDESYRQDVETAERATRPAEDVYRDLRADVEPGWDFSSRRLADGKDVATIRTTAIAPVNLNTLMTHLEETLAEAYRLAGDAAEADRFRARLWENSSKFSSGPVSFAFSSSQTLQSRKNHEEFCSARSFAKFR